MKKNRAVISAVALLGVIAVSTFWLYKNPKEKTVTKNLVDEALLALIKNDQSAFENFLNAGGNVHDVLPVIDGKRYTVAQGIAYFERPGFAALLNEKGIGFVTQDETAPHDIMTIAVRKNGAEVLSELMKSKVNYQAAYGKNGWTLLHMASAWCSHNLTESLHEKGKLSWDLKAKDGTTPLTLAALNDCLPMLSYWKEKGANFKAKDGRGNTALSILRKKKDAALTAFAQSFEERKIATISKPVKVPDFYKKRKIPKDQVVDHAAMLEPEDRPLEATETAEFSEFAD